MIERFKCGTCFALIVTGLLTMPSIMLAADTRKNSADYVTARPYGVLSNAASAAAAAAEAAGAAANAANAAARAATAALDAINSINQQSPVLLQTPSTQSPSYSAPDMALQTAGTKPVPPQTILPGQASSGPGKFTVPAERSLVGLVGKFEIPVFINMGGELGKSLAGYQALENTPMGESSDTNLSESISAGRGFSRDTLIAGARTDQAKAQTGQSLALLLPSVSVRANRGIENSAPSVAIDPATGRPRSSDTHMRTDTALVVRQTLFDLPSYFDWRRRGVVEQARSETYRATDGDAYIATVNAYLSLVSSRLLADMTRDFEVQLKELLVYVEKRAAAGAASVSDMARVRARSLAAVSSRMEQESAHAAAGIEFVRLTNRVPRMVRLPELNDVGASMMPESLDYAVTMAMLQNPEIASLKYEVLAASIDKSVAKSRFLPRIDMEYTDNYALHAGGDTSSAGQRDKRFMFVANWSIFSGGGDYRYHDERAARHVELKYRLDDQRRRIVQNLSANYATIDSTKQRLAVGYNELKSISTAAEAMSKRMLSGNQSLLDLLDVYDRYYQSRVRLVNLHTQEMNTVAQVVRLVSGIPMAGTTNHTDLKGTAEPKGQPSFKPAEKTITPEGTANDKK